MNSHKFMKMHTHSNKIILIHVDCGLRQCAVCSVQCAVCGTLIHAVCAVCAAVCGSARGSVWLCLAVRQCAVVRQCAAVCAAVCGSARGSVR